jgi:hypothetical protein
VVEMKIGLQFDVEKIEAQREEEKEGLPLWAEDCRCDVTCPWHQR